MKDDCRAHTKSMSGHIHLAKVIFGAAQAIHHLELGSGGMGNKISIKKSDRVYNSENVIARRLKYDSDGFYIIYFFQNKCLDEW